MHIQEVSVPFPSQRGILWKFVFVLESLVKASLYCAVLTACCVIDRANMACLMGCYMILLQNWPPHLALAPLAQMEPPVLPFRDAGYSQADFTISVQDVVYGVWKAKEEGALVVKDFSLEEYVLNLSDDASRSGLT
jgi:hypothetical protein